MQNLKRMERNQQKQQTSNENTKIYVNIIVQTEYAHYYLICSFNTKEKNELGKQDEEHYNYYIFT